LEEIPVGPGIARNLKRQLLATLSPGAPLHDEDVRRIRSIYR